MKQRSQPIIRTPASDNEWQAYYRLRWEILRQPWQQPEGSEKDELEDDAWHFAAFGDNNAIIGVARLHRQSASIGQIRYMAVAPEYRGKGTGKRLLAAIESQARSLGLTGIELNARENAVDFYQYAGYEVLGPAHTLYGCIPHLKMCKTLKD